MKATSTGSGPLKAGKIILFLALCLVCMPGLSASVDNSTFQSYIERHANGWIDWQQGLIYGIGRGYLYNNGNSRPRAKGAASVLASGNIVKLAAGVNLDDANTLKSIGSGRVVIQLKAFLRDQPHRTEFVGNVPKPYYEVINVADMRGIKGLTAKLLDHLKNTRQWKDFPIDRRQASLDDEDQPWLVLDSRNAEGSADQLRPALFPKIKSETGEVIHELPQVEAAALYNRGMMQYVTTDISPQRLRSDRNALDELLTRAGQLLPVDEAFAADKKRRRRGRYIVKDVKHIEGLTKTNLVVSAADATSMKSEDLSSKVLKNCRVLVVISSPVGGIEGQLERHLAKVELRK